jgi:hypothetical protein
MAWAFDTNHHLLLMYGGRTPSDTWLDDTWKWDGAAWTQLQPTQHPTLRFAMGAFDPAISKLVVYGLTSDLTAAQTWTWDGNWQQVATSVSPPPRYSSALAYDPTTRAVILFGGRQTFDYLGDTWAFDGATWRQVTTNAAFPSARQNPLLATVTEGVLLFGGDANFTRLTDTWMWSGSGWQVLPVAHSPTVGWGAVGIASRDGQAVVLSYGSLDGPAQTYLFSQGDWSAT